MQDPFDNSDTLGVMPWTCMGDPFCAANGGPSEPYFPEGGFGFNGGSYGHTPFQLPNYPDPRTVQPQQQQTTQQQAAATQRARQPTGGQPGPVQTLPYQLPPAIAGLPPTILGIDTKTVLIGAGILGLVLIAGKGK